MKKFYCQVGVYPSKLLKFYDFHLLKVGVKKEAFNGHMGYGTQIVFCNLYIAAWLFFKQTTSQELILNKEG